MPVFLCAWSMSASTERGSAIVRVLFPECDAWGTLARCARTNLRRAGLGNALGSGDRAGPSKSGQDPSARAHASRLPLTELAGTNSHRAAESEGEAGRRGEPHGEGD